MSVKESIWQSVRQSVGATCALPCLKPHFIPHFIPHFESHFKQHSDCPSVWDTQLHCIMHLTSDEEHPPQIWTSAPHSQHQHSVLFCLPWRVSEEIGVWHIHESTNSVRSVRRDGCMSAQIWAPLHNPVTPDNAQMHSNAWIFSLHCISWKFVMHSKLLWQESDDWVMH